MEVAVVLVEREASTCWKACWYWVRWDVTAAVMCLDGMISEKRGRDRWDSNGFKMIFEVVKVRRRIVGVYMVEFVI